MNKRILVIDDEPVIRRAFQLALEDTDCTVDLVSSGKDGIQACRQKNYDIIFLDLKMPGLNGAETLRQIREFNSTSTIFIVTAFYAEFFDQLQTLIDNGIRFEVLRKPVGADEIIRVVESFCADKY